MNEIELRDLFALLRRKAWIIRFVTALSLLICSFITFYVLEPEYEAFVTFVVGVGKPLSYNENIKYSDVLLNEKLVSTYKEIAKSITVSDTVIKNLDLDITNKEFAKKVKVIQVEDSQIIKILIKDKNPEFAAKIANEVSKVFLTHVMTIMKMENVQVLDEAKVPIKPSKPKPILYLMISGILGVFISVFFILIYQYFDNTIKTSDDVEKNLGLSVIGRIFRFSMENNNSNPGIIIDDDTWSLTTEAIRTLRTNIQFLSASKNIKAILITSTSVGEGKSTMAVNIAASVAQINKKVLLMDCDLRRPILHSYFKVLCYKGITNYLSEDIDYHDLIQYTGIEHLYFLSSGPIPPNPAELLATNKFKSLLEDIMQEYDMIVIDSSPIGLVTDAAVMSTVVDGVILVCAVKQCTIEAAKYALSMLKDVNAKVLGAVLNKIPHKKNTYYSHKYYSYYGGNQDKVYEGEEG